VPDSVTSLHPMYPYSEHLPCRCGLFRRRGLRFIELHLWLNLSLIHLFISLNWYWARTACANEFLQIGAMRQTAQIKAHNSVKKTRKTHDDAGIYHALARQKSVRILTVFLQVWQLFFSVFWGHPALSQFQVVVQFYLYFRFATRKWKLVCF